MAFLHITGVGGASLKEVSLLCPQRASIQKQVPLLLVFQPPHYHQGSHFVIARHGGGVGDKSTALWIQSELGPCSILK